MFVALMSNHNLIFLCILYSPYLCKGPLVHAGVNITCMSAMFPQQMILHFVYDTERKHFVDILVGDEDEHIYTNFNRASIFV